MNAIIRASILEAMACSHVIGKVRPDSRGYGSQLNVNRFWKDRPYPWNVWNDNKLPSIMVWLERASFNYCCGRLSCLKSEIWMNVIRDHALMHFLLRTQIFFRLNFWKNQRQQQIKTNIIGKPTLCIVYWLIVRFIIKHAVPAAAVDHHRSCHCDSFLQDSQYWDAVETRNFFKECSKCFLAALFRTHSWRNLSEKCWLKSSMLL